MVRNYPCQGPKFGSMYEAEMAGTGKYRCGDLDHWHVERYYREWVAGAIEGFDEAVRVLSRENSGLLDYTWVENPYKVPGIPYA